MDIQGFNDGVNSFLAPVWDNPYLLGLMKLSLVMFGGLAAPKITPKYGHLFSNTYFRVLVMVLIIWTFNHDPALSIILAVSYFIVMEHVVKNAVKEVSQTGTVTPAIASILGAAPPTQPRNDVQAEVGSLQAAVDASKAAGFVTSVPQAVMSSGPVSTGAEAAIPTQPSGVPASATTMIAEGDGGGIPQAYTPDGIASLAEAPK